MWHYRSNVLEHPSFSQLFIAIPVIQVHWIAWNGTKVSGELPEIKKGKATPNRKIMFISELH